MLVRELAVEGALAFTPNVFKDHRGSFTSPYQDAEFVQRVGGPPFPVRQVSHSRSARGVLRGVHYTATPPGMAKYVFCPSGQIQDFVVDLRVGSPTFGRWDTVRLDAENGSALYVPVGVGHAFVALQDDSVTVYLMSQGFVPKNDLAVAALDPGIGLPLPKNVEPIQSGRDSSAPTLEQALSKGLLPEYEACMDGTGLPL
ncbi:dTDP-4-dehydrorhamnose 3,5-epimerase family protein [Actinomadura sp. 1N219]|uniref:dTDP-4-dehydrorhamnose 3,5-epimerase family protein n=1 Tax=Actinomadura sp. 1N219 TaxID=3375152 RepID=UPI0037B96C59